MTVSEPPTRHDIKRYRANFRDEVDGVALYQLLAEAEKDPGLKEVFGRMAKSEERHLAIWERKLQEAGADVPARKPSTRVRIIGWLARRFGTSAVSPIVTAMEQAATTMYDGQPEAVEEGLPAEERSHARLFREIGRPRTATAGAASIARLEGRHRVSSGNALRAAVLGVEDGLVSTVSLVMGVAGADPGRDVVFLAGISGLLAGAFSMAMGEWISVKTSTEAFDRQLAIEKEELEALPEEEEEELTLIYRAKGLSAEDARDTARRIISNKDTALETLAREELGMSSDELGTAWVAALTSFLLFTLGAVLPVLPWLFVGGVAGIVWTAIAGGAGLFLAGAATTLFTGRGALYSGTRLLLIGAVAAAVTYGVGAAIGAGTGV